MDIGIAHIFFAFLALVCGLALFGSDTRPWKVCYAGLALVSVAGLVLSYTPVLR